MDASDEETWPAACAGDNSAFSAIFRRHVSAVRTLCARRSGSYQAADDLVSAVFLEAWRSRDRVRFVNGSMRPWLLLIASHVAAKHVRKETRYSLMLQRTRFGSSTINGTEIETRLDAESLAPQLAAAISSLNPREQELVALCDLAEFTHAEAAIALAIPVGTVKSRLSRAHAKLRTQLAPAAVRALGLEPTTSLQEVK